jgi:hypothetical protein
MGVRACPHAHVSISNHLGTGSPKAAFEWIIMIVTAINVLPAHTTISARAN